jgi:hypothetical protein
MFPAGRTSHGISAHAALLPFLEQAAAAEAVDFSVSWDHPNNAAALRIAIPTFYCPSDPFIANPLLWEGTNYRGNQGSGILWGLTPTNPSDPNFGMPDPNGVFFLNRRIRFSDITDGTAHTAAFSEHNLGDFSNAISTPADTFWTQTNPTHADEAYRDCEAIDATDLQYQRASDVGAPWLRGYHSTTIYFHVAPPNKRSCMFPPGRIATTAKSSHVGGVTLLVIEHNMRVVTAVAQRIIALHLGEVIADAAPDRVARDPKVVEAYLGQAYVA